MFSSPVVFSLAQHCNAGLFQCHSGVCVPQRYVCDHDDDCGDRSDEQNCSMSPKPFYVCPLICHKTVTHYVFSLILSCQYYPFSSPTAYPTCRGNYFTCPSGRCIHQVWVCDGEDDCEDNADEKGCGMITC